MAEHRDVQFEITLKKGRVRVPSEPVNIPADSSLFWPFNLDLGGVRLVYATAQPMCRFEDKGISFFVFAETLDVPAEFVFDAGGVIVDAVHGTEKRAGGRIHITHPVPGADPAIRLRTDDGKRIAVILLDEPASLTCWKLGPRAVLCEAELFLDGRTLHMRASDPKALAVQVLPAMDRDRVDIIPGERVAATIEPLREAGPPRQVHIGSHRVAEQPTDAEFEQAGVWRIKLPPDVDARRDLLLRIKYTGDVARLELDGKLLTDNFYNGDPFEVGLKHFAPDIYQKGLMLKVLPMPKNAPIYLSHWPQPEGASLDGVEVVEQYAAEVSLE
jgi:hypothetical protein